jgi:hypothetical protein
MEEEVERKRGISHRLELSKPSKSGTPDKWTDVNPFGALQNWTDGHHLLFPLEICYDFVEAHVQLYAEIFFYFVCTFHPLFFL